jgi:hypothetical protein
MIFFCSIYVTASRKARGFLLGTLYTTGLEEAFADNPRRMKMI